MLPFLLYRRRDERSCSFTTRLLLYSLSSWYSSVCVFSSSSYTNILRLPFISSINHFHSTQLFFLSLYRQLEHTRTPTLCVQEKTAIVVSDYNHHHSRTLHGALPLRSC
ncbi:unnamed protein product [Amoebophrya sp. A25]|nr:unnamed protein product [Amoebophrya sp. A25]|eukprot:GSA25T00015702001.1